MNKFINIVSNEVMSMITLKKFFTIIIMYIFQNIIISQLFEKCTFNDLITFLFYGGNNLIDKPIVIMSWIALQVILIYIVLSYIHYELNLRVKLIILRIGNKQCWINSIFISTFLFCFFYFLLGLVIFGILNWNLMVDTLDFMYLLKILLLLTLYSYSICMMGFVFLIIIRNYTVILSIIIFCYYIAITIGEKYSKYIIFSQGILAKHYYGYLDFGWSYCFTILFSMLMLIIIKILIFWRDIV